EHEYINEGIASLKLGIMPGHDPEYLHGRNLYQTLLFVPEGEEGQYIDKYDNFDFIRWHPVSMDVIPKGASKAEGIAKVIDELGLPPERQYAFGDEWNETVRMRIIHNSFEMGNAKDEAKSKASHITKLVNDNSTEHGLRMAGLIE